MPEVEELTTQTIETTEVTALPADADSITTLLQKIQADTAAQRLYAKKRLGLARVCAAALAVLLAAVLLTAALLVPRVNTILLQADAVLANLSTVSDTLAGVDYDALVNNVNSLVQQSETGITKALADMEGALSVLESVDIAKLNESIADLNRVISPIAKMFGGS